MGKGKIRIGIVQMGMSDRKYVNIAKAEKLVRKAASKGADIICLPELFSTLYFPQEKKSDAHRFAEPLNGETISAMKNLAKELSVVVIAPFYEKSGKKHYNTVAVIDGKGRIAGKYRKMHIPHDPLFYEKNYFDEGNMGYKVVSLHDAKIAPLICFDQWFPEAARVVSLKGAEIIFYPTAIGNIDRWKEKEDWHSAWETVQRAHAIANSVHVVSVNRCGKEGRLRFWGGSFICDAFGKIIKKAGSGEEVLVADIDVSYNMKIRESWGFFRNRRPESYGHIRKRRK